MPNPSLTFLHTAPRKHSSSSSVCSGLLPDEVKFLRQEWKDRRGRRGMWGQLLLHFIRKLIWRLSKWILSLSFLWSPPQLEDERRCGEAGGTGQGSAQITSRLFFWLTSVQRGSVSQPVGFICLSSVFIFCIFHTTCQLGCLSHQCDLHLLCFFTLLLLSAGVLFGWRRSCSHRS